MRVATQLLPLLVFIACHAAQADTRCVGRIDVFITSSVDMSSTEQLRSRCHGISIAIHTIDGIAQVKAMLSRDLPSQRELAEKVALQRLQHIGKAEQNKLRHSADALLLARHLGVRRYPAIVFDSQWVVYGVTDLVQADAFFQQRDVGANP